MKVLITTSSFGKKDLEPLELLERAGLTVTLNPYKRTLSEEEIKTLLLEVAPTGLIAGVEPLTSAVLESAKSLKAISRCGAGLDSVDLDAAARFNISVNNTPDAPTQAVAELTLGLILDLLRQVSLSDRQLRAGDWKKKMGRLLAGKTVGVIGLGRIGRRVAMLLKAFDCQVIACDLCPDNEWADAEGVVFLDKEALLGQADIVTLHLPCADKNNPLIGAREIEIMKPHSYLINAARGGLVDEEALLIALQEGRLAGAALDTFMIEPYEGPLMELDNVVLSPHVGSYAVEARVQMETEAVENLLAGLELVSDKPVGEAGG